MPSSKLKEERIAVSLSQKELGIRAGIDRFSDSAKMNQYETPKNVPDVGTVNGYEEAGNLSLSRLTIVFTDDFIGGLCYGTLIKKACLLF